MKKLMTMILALVPMGIFAQGAQAYYAFADNLIEASFADLPARANASKEIGFEVNDLLLADPDFDIQENMIAYTKDLKKVFFSANKKLKLKDEDAEATIKNSSRIHLFKADVTDNGSWVNLEMLPFNGPRHSTGHPALNKDDTKLYFAADGPESTGKTDLFTVDLLEDGTYGKPMNLGNKINSEEREIFPYVDAENVLYFASDIENDGKSLEVYASRVVDGQPSAPVKLDVAVDSPREELIAAFKSVDVETIKTAEAEAESMDLDILQEAEELAEAESMDLDILQEAEKLAEIEGVEEQFADSFSGDSYDFASEQVIYTVQIGAFLKNVEAGTYKQYSGLFHHQYQDGYNRYYSGIFASKEEAEAHLQYMKEKGFSDAFVLGLKGENRFLGE